MKKLVCLTLMMLISITATSVTKDDPSYLTLEGKFIAGKKVHYTLYKVLSDTVYKPEMSVQGNHAFSVQLEVGSKYILKFEAPDGKSKCLNIVVQTNGYFYLSIDFTNECSEATLTCNKWRGYRLRSQEKEITYYVNR